MGTEHERPDVCVCVCVHDSAPTALLKLAHEDGELAVTRACQAAGDIPFHWKLLVVLRFRVWV
jgi:hypothetical protein